MSDKPTTKGGVYTRKRFVQQVVRVVGKLVHAPNRSVRDLECRAHSATYFHIGAITVPTAIPLVLQRETRLGGRGNPHFLKVDLFFESAEPEDRREDDGKGRVEDEEPIEHDETDGYMISLDDCAHGDDERHGVEDAEDHADCGAMWTAREEQLGEVRYVVFISGARAELVTKGTSQHANRSGRGR